MSIFDSDNKVVKLCAQGMELEGRGQSMEAANLFTEAWNIANNDFEKFTAAHYVARHQKNTEDKLHWDRIALQHALKIPGVQINASLPSLYLNIGKCYEDLGDNAYAKLNYKAGLSFCSYLSDDGYGNMIKSGLMNRIKNLSE